MEAISGSTGLGFQIYSGDPSLLPPWTDEKIAELENAIYRIRTSEARSKERRNKYMYHRVIALHPAFVQDMTFPELTNGNPMPLCMMYNFPTESLMETSIDLAFKTNKIIITDSSEWTGSVLQKLGIPYLLIYPSEVPEGMPDIDIESLRKRPCCQHVEVKNLTEYKRLVTIFDPVRGIAVE